MNFWVVRFRDLLIDSRLGILRDLFFVERGLFLFCEIFFGSVFCIFVLLIIYSCIGDIRIEFVLVLEEVGCFRGLWDSRVIFGELDRYFW